MPDSAAAAALPDSSEESVERPASAPGRRLRVLASVGLALLLVTASAPAGASPATLRRSVSNLLQAPLDLLLAPMVAVSSVVTHMREQDDPIPVRVVFGFPGVVWNAGINAGSAAIRFITGGIELVPGVLLVPFDADIDPLFSPVDSGGALFEMETPCCIDVKFGIDYTAAEY